MFFRCAITSALFCLAVCGSAAPGAPDTRFVLVSQFLFSEGHPDAHFGATDGLGDRFRNAFRAHFPGRVLELSATRLLSPAEHAVVIIPRLTSVRVSRQVAGGAKYIFEANVSGSVSAVDPWSGATLFAATRLVSGEVDLDKSKIGLADSALTVAFEKAFNEWMQVCFAQLDNKLSLFELAAPTLTVPPAAAKSPGGAWPFGAERGVRRGQLLMGAHSPARVTAAFDGYSQITDASDEKRVIPAGEPYSLTVVDNASDRQEPRVSVEWAGPPPDVPGNIAFPPSIDATVALFVDYLSKSSALRVLPPSLNDPGERDKFLQMTQEVSRFAGLVHRDIIDLQRETVLQLANENPDFRVVLFTCGSYFGTQPSQYGLYHIHRVKLGAALFVRHGNEKSVVYGLSRVLLQNREIKHLYSAGIRDIDDRASSFTAWREAAAQLAQDVLSSGNLANSPAGTIVKAEIRSGLQPLWPSGLAPDSHTPLEWLRPIGNISLADGKSIRPFFEVQSPSQGFLTPAVLNAESVKQGDYLRYVRIGASTELLPLYADLLLEGTTLPLSPEALTHVIAGFFAGALHRELVLVGRPRPPLLSDLPLLYINVSGFRASQSGANLHFAADWRLLLVTGPAKTVAAKAGLRNPVDFDQAQFAGVSPPDSADLCRQFVESSLTQLLTGTVRADLDRVLVSLSQPEGIK